MPWDLYRVISIFSKVQIYNLTYLTMNEKMAHSFTVLTSWR